MSTNTDCNAETRQANAQRYATSKMTPAEAAAFEDHFVACADCQREIRLASAVASGLQGASSGRASAWPWLGVGALLAAGIAAFALLQRPDGALVALGRVAEPPIYLGVPMRGSGTEAAFDAAMAAYAQRSYDDAIRGLRDALATRDSVPAQFFLGASLLMTGRASEAAAAFEATVARGESPYRAEARYYLAKALLRLGRSGEARALLEQITASDGVVFDMSKALGDSLARLPNK